MSIVPYPRVLLALFLSLLLSACNSGGQVACDEQAQRRAIKFMTQVLEQESNGLRLRELASPGGRRVFYANVSYDPAEETRSDLIYIRNGFTIVEAICASEVTSDEGKVVAQQINVRVLFPAGLWFDRETYGELPAGEHIYTLHLSDRFKITGTLAQPFVSGKTAMSLLGTEPYTTERLMMLREDLEKGAQQ
jgi:hypothetical protein